MFLKRDNIPPAVCLTNCMLHPFLKIDLHFFCFSTSEAQTWLPVSLKQVCSKEPSLYLSAEGHGAFTSLTYYFSSNESLVSTVSQVDLLQSLRRVFNHVWNKQLNKGCHKRLPWAHKYIHTASRCASFTSLTGRASFNHLG